MMQAMRRKSSRERAPSIHTLIEETEYMEEEEEEKEPAPLQQKMETISVPTMQTTADSVTVRALVVPINPARPRRHLVRRSSSAVERITPPAPKEEKNDGGDKSLRPRFLQERSATIVHITPSAMDPSRVPHSKASAFLLDVLSKSKVPSAVEGRRTSLEPLRPGVTNTLHYVPPEGIERGLPLRMAARNNRRFGRQLSIGPSSDLLERVIPDGARTRRVSASQEHISAIVRALQASKQQLHQQLGILHSILRFINANERDGDGKRPILEEMVDVGMIPELASIMREFRFHTGLQVCVMNILSALTEESHLYAYMMSEFNLEKLIEKTAATHASHDRLIMLASNLVHAIEESKHTVNIPAYQAEKAARMRRQSASYADMLVAAISKPKQPLPSPSLSAKSSTSRRTCKQLSMTEAEVARSRALIGNAPPSDKSGCDRDKLSSSQSAGRQRQAFALAVAPPALSANYRLLFSQKLKRSEVLPLPVADSDIKGVKAAGEHPHKRDRPATSPSRKSQPLDLTSRSLTAAIYSGGSIFVEPSPLLKRMPYRGSFSAGGGVRRRLSVHKKIQRAHTERLPPTQLSTRVSLVQPSPALANAESSLRQPLEANDVAIEDNSTVTGTQESDESAEEESSEEEDEEESYEDDFDTTTDDSDGDKKMPSRQDSSQIGSDGELIDMLHGISAQKAESSLALTSAETEAATTIQRHIRGALARREYTRERSSASSKNSVQAPGKKTTQITNCSKSERRGSKGKHIPLSARVHRQLRHQGSSRRDNSRVVSRTRHVMALSPSLVAPGRRAANQAKAPIQGRVNGGASLQRWSQESNNQLVSLQLGGSSSPKQVFVLSEVEPEHKSEVTEVVKEPPDPKALKQIQTLYAEGLQYHKDGHLGLAIECYEKALAIPGGQDFASLHLNLGSALMARNKFSEAFESFEQAKRVQPNNIKAMYNSSLVLLHLDRPQEAQRLLRLILELEPTHVKATIALSHLQSNVGSPATEAR